MPSRPQPHSAPSPEPISRDHENEDPLEDYESFKRFLSKLEMISPRSKSAALKTPTLVPFVKAAKSLPRTISPYSSFEDALEVGHFRESLNVHEMPEIGVFLEAFPAMDKYRIRLALEVYRKYSRMIGRPLRRRIKECNLHELQPLHRFVDEFSKQARTEDVSALKDRGISFVPHNVNTDNVVPPIPTGTRSKAGRGWHHHVTARLLCPRHMLTEFDADPDQFCEDVLKGKIRINAGDWPTFLYDEDTPYDPDHIDNGLCRGYIIQRAFRCIFTGPRTAKKDTPGPSSGKTSKSKLGGISRVTGRAIAYICVQTRLFLSEQDSWGLSDGDFDYTEFFNKIVELFEDDPEDDWAVETLEWWNYWVYGAKEPSSAPQVNNTSPTLAEKLAEQRRARRNARIATPPM